MAADTTTRPTGTGFAPATGFVAAALLCCCAAASGLAAVQGEAPEGGHPIYYRYNKRWFLSFSVTFHEQNPHTQ